jgi:Divergent InlB B-repeat domain
VIVGARSDSGAAENAQKASVSVRTKGTQGVVVSVPRGITCPDDCRAEFRRGSEVTLVAGSRPNSRLLRWQGGCVGTSAICVLVAEPGASVTATFVRANVSIGGAIQTRYPLTVTVSGPGSVRSSPSGIDCPPESKCEKTFKKGTSVTLTATSSRSGYTVRWTSYLANCSGESCEVTMNANVDVSATFRKP